MEAKQYSVDCVQMERTVCKFREIFLEKSRRNKVMTSNMGYGILIYEGWNFNSGNYLFTTDTK